VLAGLLFGALTPGALADQQIQASPSIRYTATSVTMDQGERLTFQNLDVADHDVTATKRGADGKVLFGTPLIGTGEEAFVEGSQFLTTGDYDFVCSIHANMQGTLHVTSAGTPVPRSVGPPPGPADRKAPAMRVKFRSASTSRVRRARELVVDVSVNEAAKVGLTAAARVGRRKLTLASGSAELTGAGTRRPKLTLTQAGRRLLARRRRVTVTVTARAVDSAGNRSSASARRTLKR
jgi:plastocyanin